MAGQRLKEVTYNGGSFTSTYCYDLKFANDLFDIWGNPAPYTLNIEVTPTDEEGGAIKLTFTGNEGEVKEVLLPKDPWLDRIKRRLELTDDYNHAVKHGDFIEIESADGAKSAHHDMNAKELEDLLLYNGIQVSGDLKRGKNGASTDTYNAARDLFGTITEALTPLLTKMGPVASSAKNAGRDDL